MNTTNDDSIFLSSEEEEAPMVIEHVFKNFNPDLDDHDLTVNANLIKLDHDDLLALLRLAEPIEENQSIVWNSIHIAPYKWEFVKQVLLEWWCSKEGNTPETLQILNIGVNCPKKSNKWLFWFLSRLPTAQRNYMLETYFNNTIDPDMPIDTSIFDEFTLTDIRNKDYRKRSGYGIRVGEFMTDMLRVVRKIDVVPPMIILKVKDPKYNNAQLSIITRAQLQQTLKTINLGKTNKNITAWKVLTEGKNMNYLTIAQMTFKAGKNNIHAFSYFHGFDYPRIDGKDINQDLIKPFLGHIYNIICSRRDDVYKYVLKWLAFIFQNVGQKTKTAIVIKGLQGTGKNTFTDVICNLIGGYANPNAKLENLTGTFNSGILYKMLIVCNEIKSFMNDKKYDNNELKRLITEDSFDIVQKYKDTMMQQNVANFIFLSNNFAPLMIEEDDRRFLVIEVSAERRGDEHYFQELYEKFTPQFYTHLLSYFINIQCPDWNLNEIPITKEKMELINFCKNPYSAFIQIHLEKFVKGIAKKEAFDTYKAWCIENGYKIGSLQDFRMNILNYCQETKPWNGGENRNTLYKLRPDSYEFFGIEKIGK